MTNPLQARWIAPLVCIGALAACASSNPPSAPVIAAGEASVEAARASGAPEFASAELGEAQTKLARARTAAQTGDKREAVRLAEEADVDAQLARARANSERSRRAVAEVEASLRTLREELSRPIRAPQ